MKTLLLMRHAKSSWKKEEVLPDKDRPLNKRGKRDAALMGELLVDRELVPQRIITSSALRAYNTAELVAEASGFQGQIDPLDSLYMAEPPAYVSALRELGDDMERVMLIGHNPGLESLLQLLSHRIEALPTAVLAHIVLPIREWSELSYDTTGEMVEIWHPKELRREEEEKEKEKEKEKEREKRLEKEREKEKEKAKEKEKEKEKEKKRKKDK